MRKLYIEPTSMCNLNCKMCFRNNWFEEEQGVMQDIVLERIYDFIFDSRNLQSVMLAGMGEPLLHKKICEIIRKISCAGKKSELLTNATLLTEEKSHQLIDAGLDILWCSIDDSHLECVDALSEGVLDNIGYFNKIRGNACKLGFTFVIDKSDNFEKINNFARDFSCNEVNISGVIPSEPVEEIYDLKEILKNNNIGNKNYCPFIEDEKCFIKWNGDVCPCMPLLHNSYTYLYQEKRKVFGYSFGNVLEKSISNIWNSLEYRTFRERVLNFEFPDCTLCDGCDDRLENRTDCMFNEMPTCGACLWAQNIARCP